MFKLLLLFIGIILTSIGLCNIFLYLNLLVLGYSFLAFLKFIFTSFFTLIFWLGLVFLYLGIKKK